MTLNTDKAYKVFGARLSDKWKNSNGDPIELEVLPDRTDSTKDFVPELDDSYKFPVEETISLAIALDQRVKTPVLLWGRHGSGKSTLAEQVCAKLNRPCMRVQHSVDTEGSDIVGQWTLIGGETKFLLGPLARCMKDGIVYIADEYDFSLPNVLAIYQAVLEGAPLFIKNAPDEMAVVKPHPDFRIIATGNTNGSGDETGLYQGTQIQNAANYSRFGITIKIDYQPEKIEREIIAAKVGELPEVDMGKLMQFTNLVREGYENRHITNTLSTRELITIARLSVLRAKDTPNWAYGIDHGFRNRMSTIDGNAVKDIMQRVFGE